MRSLVLVMVLMFSTACCHKQPVPVPPVPKSDLGAPACTVAPRITNADSCNGIFYKNYYNCVACPGVSGCIDTKTMVYCVSGGCLQDPNCKAVQDMSPGSN